MGKAKISEIKDKKQMVFISYSSTNEQKFEDCMKQMIKEHSTDTKKLAQVEKVGSKWIKYIQGSI